MDETGFDREPIAQIVIDDQNRVTGINQAARTLFSLRQQDVGRPLHDLELSCRTGELRSLIADVRENQRTLVRSDVTWQPQSAEPRTLAVQIDPLTLPGTDFTGAIVTCTDVTEQRALQIELGQTRRELAIAYEELKATVDALETTNEELRSTSEGLETTNEELQSTNQVLETTSEELRSTNEALETMNDELRERTSETLQADSVLASVLSGIPQGVVVVDDTLRVIVWSRRATDLWGLRDDEAEGEHLLNLDSDIPVERLRDPIRRVLAGEKEAEIELDAHDRRGNAVHVKIVIAPLESLPGTDERFGAILLVSAERPG
jgi:two-component system CheB/CheR fusion protein